MDMDMNINYVGSLYGHNGIVTSIVVGKDSNGKPLVVSGARDRKIIVWNLNLDSPQEVQGNKDETLVGKPKKSLSGHNHFVSSLALSSDSTHLISGSWDRTVRLWDMNSFKTKIILQGHEKDVLSVAFHHDGRLVLSGSMDGTLRVWNTKGEEKHKKDEFNGWVSHLGHIRKQDKDNLLAVSSLAKSVNLYSSNDLKHQSTISGYDYGVVCTASDEDGDFLFAAEKNGKIRVQKLNEDNTATLKSTIDVNADINAISFESKYYMTITCATSKGLVVNEVNKVNKSLFSKTGSACHSLAWDDTKTYLFAGFADGVIRVFKFRCEA